MKPILVAAALLVCLPASALAQEADDTADDAGADDAAARAHFERGRAAYAREVYTEAEDAFLAAYEAMEPGDERRTLILLNVAQSIERQGGRDEDALHAWQRFRAEAGDVADPQHLARADERIRELTERVARRRGSAPIETTPEDDGGFSPHWSGIVVLSVGGAMALAGVITGAYGLAERGDVLSSCAGTVCPESVRERADQLDTLGLVTDVLLWPGLGIAAAGALMMVLISDDGGSEDVAVSCGPGGCMMRGSF